MLILSILFILIARARSPVITSILFSRIAILVLLYSSLLAWNTFYLEPIGVGVGVSGGLFHVTLLSQALDCFILGCAMLILLLGSCFVFFTQVFPPPPITVADGRGVGKNRQGCALKKNNGGSMILLLQHSCNEYPLIILLTTLGMSSFVSSSDLLSMFLSIELQTLALYILATLYRYSEAATSAGLKYFLLGALSSSLLLLGSTLLYAFTGVSSFEGVSMLCYALATPAIQLGLLLIAIALLFKLAAAPFHNWAPDVYEGVPTIVTTWLAIMPKVAILGLLSDLQALGQWGNLLIVSAMISLLIGGVVGVAQYRIKRLLAYSTISHIGFLLLALAIPSAEALEGFLLYLVQYVLTSTNIFCVLVAFGYSAPAGATLDPSVRPKLLATSRGHIDKIIPMIQIKSHPALGVTLAMSLFSMAGIPPLVGFFGKVMVLYSATHSGYLLLATIAILVSVISAAYYLRVIRLIFFDTPKFYPAPPLGDRTKGSSLHSAPYPPSVALYGNHSMVIASITLLIIMFIAKPKPLLNSIHLLALCSNGLVIDD